MHSNLIHDTGMSTSTHSEVVVPAVRYGLRLESIMRRGRSALCCRTYLRLMFYNLRSFGQSV